MNGFYIFKYHPKFSQRTGCYATAIEILAPTQEEAKELAIELAPANHFTCEVPQDAFSVSMAEIAASSSVPAGYYWSRHPRQDSSLVHNPVNFRERKIDKLLR